MEIGTRKISKEEVIQVLESESILILATSAGDRVTVRPMSYINEGLDILFQTDMNSLKMQQIRDNPNVALCIGTYQIEGTAAELGPPLAESNKSFANAYKEKHPSSYEKYSAYEEEVVIIVTVHTVRQWRYESGQPRMAEMFFA